MVRRPHRFELAGSLLRWTLVALVVAAPRPARADAQECIAAHARGQELEREAKLLEAREVFATCAVASCPDMIRKECQALQQAVGERIPSLIVSVLGKEAQSAAAVQITIDGTPLDQAAAAAPVPVDPGTHRVRFEAPSGEVREVEVTVKEGSGSTQAIGDFRKDEPPQRAEPRSRAEPPPDYGERPKPPTDHDEETAEDDGGISLGPPIMGGIGLLSLGVFTLFAVSGKDQENKLLDECAPSCDEEEVAIMRRRYAGADASLILGGALIVGAVIWLAVDLSGSDDETAPEDPPASESVALAPAPAGTGLGLLVSF